MRNTGQNRKEPYEKKSRRSDSAEYASTRNHSSIEPVDYGYNDPWLVNTSHRTGNAWRWIAFALALMFIFAVWYALDQKLLLGGSWISPTYDNPDWRTNEGTMHTYGAWDIETHIWKTEYIMKNFPNFRWNPYWYLGMPLIKYYQPGFYLVHWATIIATGLDPARSALLLIIFAHLLAATLTFILCYKVSRKIWIAALCSIFVLSNTFISLRSYGWEPITVVFLFLYPLGLLLFLKEPLRPFRFWLIIVLAAAYLSHPLLWFSLCMFMGIYLFSLAIRNKATKEALNRHYIFEFIGVVICSLLIGAIQFIPQMTYQQATSGAHMGVKYLPYYQVPYNIISLKDFFFDAGNLKGPGPIVMIAFLLLIFFAYIHYIRRGNKAKKRYLQKLHEHELVAGLALVLLTMILFYYLELYNIFPMNVLRSIQYHRIIPEFIITAAVLVAALSNVIFTQNQKKFYYAMLIAFVLASGIIVYIIQTYWQTSNTISDRPEFIQDQFAGRISFPYPDQSLAVRSSFNGVPDAYGYYEQGITNTYDDEIFSVSSGFHDAESTILYLQAADVTRLYVNLEEGERDSIMKSRLFDVLDFHNSSNSRYAYFSIPIRNPSFSQAVDSAKAADVKSLEPGCREIFKEVYCGSRGEEFVSTDNAEREYLKAYVDLLDKPYQTDANIFMNDPDHYTIYVTNATQSTAVVVKMTYDKDFKAYVNGNEVPITEFGPDFMLISPSMQGDYKIKLDYGIGWELMAGALISAASLLSISIFFMVRRKLHPLYLSFRKGDLYEQAH